jgi:hypothetical protein
LLSAKQIAPGQSGQVEVTIDTKNLSGPITKTVTVMSNDPRQGQVVLTVSGTIQPEFELSDQAIFFGNVPKGQEASKELLITITADKNYKVLSAESSDPVFAIKLTPVPASNDKQVKVAVTLKSDAPSGYHSAVVTVKTSSSRNPELKFVARAMVSGS